MKTWIAKNERPLVVPFDERTIGDVFGQAKLGIVLFNGADSNVLLNFFQEAAKDYSNTDGAPIIFTEISSANEHLANFADYIKVNDKKSPIVMIKAEAQQKFVMRSEVTK